VDVVITESDVLSSYEKENVTNIEDEDSELELGRLLLVLDLVESVDVMLALSIEDVLDVGIAEDEGDVVLGLTELDVRLVEVDDIEVEDDPPPPPPPPPVLELEDEDTEQTSATTVFESKTIDAPIAKSPPLDVADVVSVTDSAARIVPWKVDPTPSVADDPTCQ
jgi:hypothetical protein